MAVQLDASGTSSATAITDKDGIRTLGGMTCYYDQGPFSILASAGKEGKPNFISPWLPRRRRP